MKEEYRKANKLEKVTYSANEFIRLSQLLLQVFTDIEPATPFYRGEEYHQKFYDKNMKRGGYYI